ncbi:MAG: ABC transporter permease [Alphaproteobacteria bacterium]
MSTLRMRLFQFAVFGGAIVLWELSVRQTGQLWLYPFPWGILETAWQRISDGTLLSATAGSLQRVLVGFAIASVLGVALGALMGSWSPVYRGLSPIVDSLRSIAPIAWIPMAIMWLGITGNAALFIVAYAAFFPFVLNTTQAIRQIDRNLVHAARMLGAGRIRVLRSILLPSALPRILVGARISMGFAWGSIIAAELAMGFKVGEGSVAAVGLGQLMVDTLYIERDINGLVLYIIVIGLVSLVIDRGTRQVEKVFVPWNR